MFSAETRRQAAAFDAIGERYDDEFVFPAGMVLVLEPVMFTDGTGGYRSEEIVVITDDGATRITDYPYTPYGD